MRNNSARTPSASSLMLATQFLDLDQVATAPGTATVTLGFVGRLPLAALWFGRASMRGKQLYAAVEHPLYFGPMAIETSPRITALLNAWGEGDESALVHLMPVVYDELRTLASRYLRRERRNHSLPTSALVHEAFLRLVGQNGIAWQNRRHFFGIAARTMRQVLVDHARMVMSSKRGSGERISLEDAPEVGWMRPPELLALDEALERLAEVAPEQARIVELRFFGGLTAEEIAAVLEISVPTITRRWRVARAWLYQALNGESETPADGT